MYNIYTFFQFMEIQMSKIFNEFSKISFIAIKYIQKDFP